MTAIERPPSDAMSIRNQKRHSKKQEKRPLFHINPHLHIDNDWQTESDGRMAMAIATTSFRPQMMNQLGHLSDFNNSDDSIGDPHIQSTSSAWSPVDPIDIDIEFERNSMPITTIMNEWPLMSREEASWMARQRRVNAPPNPRRDRVMPSICRSKKIQDSSKFKEFIPPEMCSEDCFRSYVEHDESTSIKVVNESTTDSSNFAHCGYRYRLMEAVDHVLPCEHVSSEIMYRSNVSTLSPCGPWISADVVKKLEGDKKPNQLPIDLSMNISFLNAETIMRTVKIFAPDRYNWSAELSQIDKQFVHPLKDILYNEKIELVVPKHDFKILVSVGGTCDFMDTNESCSLLSNFHPANNSYDHLKVKHRGIVDIRELTDMERVSARYGKNEYRNVITFNDLQSARTVLHNFNNREDLLKICPNFLLLGSCSLGTEKSVEIRMTWLRNPPGKYADVLLKHPADMKHAMDIFYYNQVYVLGDRKPGERKIQLQNFPSWIVSDDDLSDFVYSITEPNEIEVEKVNLAPPFRSQNLSPTDTVDVYQAISAHLVQVGIDCDVWPRDINERPSKPDMSEYVKEYTRFPWTLEMNSNQNSNEHVAVVRFSDFDLGCSISEALNSEPSSHIFSLNIHDRRGVVSRGCIRMSLSVPIAVRRVCAKDIERLDESLRDASSNDDWARLVDGSPDSMAFRITVQGFPKRRVEEALAVLQTIVDVDIFECDTTEKQSLFYGMGKRYMESIRREMASSILLDVDQTRNRLSLYGTREGKDIFKKRMRNLAEKRDRMLIITTLPLQPPRYLHSLYEFMKKMAASSGTTWADAIGAKSVKFINDSSHLVEFHGTLPQYERFLEILDDVEEKLFSSVESPYLETAKNKPNCVICMTPVHLNFYCLEMCGHHACRECLNKQVHSSIQSRSFPLKCVECEEEFAVRDIKNLLLGGADRLIWLDSSKLASYIRSSIDVILRKKGSNYSACLTPDCDGIFQRIPAAPGLSPPLMECASCSRKMCRSCALDEHPGQTCEQNKYIRENADESLRTFIRGKGIHKVRKCPKEGCSAIIEKDAGCNHMQCPQCGTHFCWICQHQTATEGKMYQHLSEQHGGADGGWRFENGRLVDVPEGNEDALIQQLMLDGRLNAFVPFA